MAKLAILSMSCCLLFLSLVRAEDIDEIAVNNKTNRTFVDGDIVLTIDQQLDRELRQKAKSDNYHLFGGPQNVVVDYSRYNWPDAKVYYEISAIAAGHSKTKKAIDDAIAEYEAKTCIRFIQRTTQSDYVYFFKGSGCWSYIGRVGGKQEISIGNGCEYKGIVIHEIFHALGRWHEQSRPDRDNYVNIHTENIINNALSNFDKLETSTIITTQGISYDFGSVMHYYSHAFSKNGQATITPKDSSIPLNTLGQRNGLSDKDLQHARILYCNGSVAGSWGSWSSWSSCTKTCNGGTQYRNRTCVGGTGCTGLSYETRQCNTDDCPAPPTWSSWGNWEACTHTCGTGRQRRTRTCQNGNTCPGESLEYRDCNTKSCPQPVEWSSWGSWSTCSATCKGGQQERRRHCNHGTTCPGVSTQVRSCNDKIPCTPDPSSGEWSQWTTCSASCGGGTRSRSKQCGLSDKSKCTSQTEDCNTNACPGPLDGLKHLGCFFVPRYSRRLTLFEGKTDELSDNPIFRSKPVEKCGKGALEFHMKIFALSLGYCISGSNSSADYLTSSGTYCTKGRGGYYSNYFYMDVYEIQSKQSFSDALQGIVRSSTATPVPTGIPVSTGTPGTVQLSGASSSISNTLLLTLTTIFALVLAVLF